MGLSKLLLNADTVEHIIEMAENGSLANIDLTIKDITAENSLGELSRDLTAANFGNVSDIAEKADISAGILNLVLETVGMVSTFGARSVGVKDIILTGNLTHLDICRKKFEQFCEMYKKEGLNFRVPPLSPYSTVIGTALCPV